MTCHSIYFRHNTFEDIILGDVSLIFVIKLGIHFYQIFFNTSPNQYPLLQSPSKIPNPTLMKKTQKICPTSAMASWETGRTGVASLVHCTMFSSIQWTLPNDYASQRKVLVRDRIQETRPHTTHDQGRNIV